MRPATAGGTVLPAINVFARDLHARDTLLFAAYPDRAVFLLKPDDTGVASLLRFHPVSVDSLYRTWGLGSLP